MKNQVWVLKQSDERYPKLLREIHDPPKQLYVWGNLNLDGLIAVAVVGSRRATNYGRTAVDRIIPPLARAGVVVVSGLAYGIDGAAHEVTLKSGGVTIAVLGTPINQIYPARHLGLARRIVASGGAVISESPPGALVSRWSFPVRNRIIAGLCQATVVVEAAFDSGSLITARAALDENRDVFAVPGPITSPVSAGTNNLIKLGARPITEANDLLAALGQPLIEPGSHQGNAHRIDHYLMEYLSLTEPVHIDKLAASSGKPLTELQGELGILEVRGAVRMVQPGWYIRL